MPVITAQLDMAQPLHPGCALYRLGGPPPSMGGPYHRRLLTYWPRWRAPPEEVPGAWGAVPTRLPPPMAMILPTQPANTALAWFAQFAAPVRRRPALKYPPGATPPLECRTGCPRLPLLAPFMLIMAGRYYSSTSPRRPRHQPPHHRPPRLVCRAAAGAAGRLQHFFGRRQFPSYFLTGTSPPQGQRQHSHRP